MIDARSLFDVVRRIKGSTLTQDDVDAINAVIAPVSNDPVAKVARKTGPKGIALIKQSEGLRLSAYPDPGTGGDPWTIGYGRAHGVNRSDVITEAKAEQFLVEDLATFEAAVTKLCPFTTQNQFDALVSFTYNLGEGNLRESTLRKKHNAGDYAGAAAEFLKWTKAAGRELPGLVKRRRAESQLYASTAA